MEDFGDKMQYQFVDIIRNVLESTGDKVHLCPLSFFLPCIDNSSLHIC